MEPLRITATVHGPVFIPERPIALDALLAAAVVLRNQIQPAFCAADMRPVEIPVQRSDCGRYHLASCAQYEVEARERHHTHRRPVIPELQALSPSTKRVQITAGPNKAYRIPREHIYLRDSLMTWWCVGERAEIAALLQHIHHIGKKRSVGLGEVACWDVSTCASWGPGFPVARDGVPLRILPIDYDGLVDTETGYANLTYPYWLHEREELCVLPETPR